MKERALREKENIKQHYQDMRKRESQSRQESELRRKVLNLKKKFDGMILNPKANVTGHAPEGLLKAVVEFCDAITQSQAVYQEGQMLRAGNTEEDVKRRQKMKAKLDALKDRYAEIGAAEDGANAMCYDEHIEKMLQNLQEGFDNDPGFYELDKYHLEKIYNAMRALAHTITNANRFFVMDQSKTITDTAAKMNEEINQASVRFKGADRLFRRFSMWQMRPDTFFNYICGYAKDNVGKQISKTLQRSTERMLSVQREFYNRFQELTESKDEATRKAMAEMMESPLKKQVDWGLTDMAGNPVKTSRGMMLQAYMLLEQKASFDSLCVGGFKLPRMDAYYSGDVAKAYGENEESALLSANRAAEYGELVKRIVDLKEELSWEEGSPGRRSTEEIQADIASIRQQLHQIENAGRTQIFAIKNKIEKQLTPLDRQIIKKAHEWYSYTGELMDEVYMSMYGFTRSKVKNYVPIHRDTNSLQLDIRDTVDEFNLENSGFTKNRVRSVAPILLTDVFWELNNQQSKISRYYGFAQVQRDFNQLYNTRLPGWSYSIKSKIAAKYGTGTAKIGVTGAQYIENLIKSISGANSADRGPFSAFYSAAAGSTLSLNPRVAVSQLASIPTAAAVVGWKNMSVGFARGVKTSVSKKEKLRLAQDSVWFWQRFRGEGSMRELSDLKNSGGIWGKAASSKVGKALFNWCQDMDVFATASMWAMAEEQAKENGIKPEMEGYKEAVADIYADIIRQSQPNYTDTERSDLLRNKSDAMKILTMYKTQSNQNLNILIEATGEFNRMKVDFKNQRGGVTQADVDAAREKLANAVTSVVIGGSLTFALLRTAVNFLMGSLGGYRDEDEELTLLSVMKGIGNEVFSSMAGMVVLGSDLYNFVVARMTDNKYYGLSDSAIGLLNDFKDSFGKLIDAALDPDDDVEWKHIDRALNDGLSLLGIPYGNAKKFVNAAAMWYNDLRGGTFGKFEGNVSRSKKQQYSRLFKAWKNGDQEKCNDILAVLMAEAKAGTDTEVEKEIHSDLKKYLRDAYMDGTYSRDEVLQILGSYVSLDPEDAERMVAQWDFKMETGVAINDLKKEVLEGRISESEAAEIYERIGGYSKEEAQEKAAVLAFVKQNPGCDGISYSAIHTYETYVSGTGLSADRFYQIRKDLGTLESDKDSDGKTVKNSLAQKQIEYLNGTSLSNAQKKAIMLGYISEKTLNELANW